jgi:hypothetical protein
MHQAKWRGDSVSVIFGGMKPARTDTFEHTISGLLTKRAISTAKRSRSATVSPPSRMT